MKKILTLSLALLSLATAFAQKSSLQATLSGLPSETKVLLLEPRANRLVPTDTLTPDNKGRINIEYKECKEPRLIALALLRPGTPLLHAMLLPKEKISLTVNFDSLQNLFLISSVKGSENMLLYAKYTSLLAAAAENPTAQASMPKAMEQLLRENSSLLMSTFLVTYFENAFEQYYDLYKTIRDATIKEYPNNDFVRHIDQKLRSVVAVGSEAPDIALQDRNGEERRLSALRGHVVLLDFWASWCRPCRMENPNVVRLYNKYHAQGFEVFSVSLDNNRDAWLKAISDDGLIWDNHVSDLRGWSSAGARLYGVSSIPSTYLIDAEGNIIGRNLRGPELEQALIEIFNQ